MKVICNKQHKCQKKEGCQHSEPHEPKGAGCEKGIGGVPASCNTSGLMSICVPVDSQGQYETTKRSPCSCEKCGNSHTFVSSEVHKYLPQPTTTQGD